MTDIDHLKISLLEKVEEPKGGQKTSYILKATAALRFNEYVNSTFPGVNDKEKDLILSGVLDTMHLDLINEAKDTKYDSIGIWITVRNKILENSLDIATLEIMKSSGEDIIPLYELAKMTLNKNE